MLARTACPTAEQATEVSFRSRQARPADGDCENGQSIGCTARGLAVIDSCERQRQPQAGENRFGLIDAVQARRRDLEVRQEGGATERRQGHRVEASRHAKRWNGHLSGTAFGRAELRKAVALCAKEL